jgi:hypothetical protein
MAPVVTVSRFPACILHSDAISLSRRPSRTGPGFSKLFDMRATYDFASQVAGQRTRILRFYLFEEITNLSIEAA